MIVLSRKKNESIIINDDITVVIVEIVVTKSDWVSNIHVKVSVHRNEVYEAIRRNMQLKHSTPQPMESADEIRRRISALRIEITELETRL
jgi:carbon storage regulator